MKEKADKIYKLLRKQEWLELNHDECRRLANLLVEDQTKGEETRVVKVKYSDFCDWFFSSMGRCDLQEIVNDLVECKQISVQRYADRLGYIPFNIVANKDEVVDLVDDEGEIEDPSVELMD